MLQSTNDREQDQSFSMRIEEVKEGEFKATATSFPKQVQTGQTAKQAARKLNQELQSLHRSGKLKK